MTNEQKLIHLMSTMDTEEDRAEAKQFGRDCFKELSEHGRSLYRHCFPVEKRKFFQESAYMLRQMDEMEYDTATGF